MHFALTHTHIGINVDRLLGATVQTILVVFEMFEGTYQGYMLEMIVSAFRTV